MAILTKQTANAQNASMAKMGAAVSKQQAKALNGSMASFKASISKQAGKAISASQSFFGGLLSKTGTINLTASMASFGNPSSTLDNVYFSGAVSGSSFTQAFFVRPDGTNLALAVDVVTVSGTAISSVTYNGAAVQMIQTTTFTSNTQTFVMWQGVLAGPATGTNNLVVMLAGVDTAFIGIRSFTGINQSTPVNFSGFSTQSASPSLTATTTIDQCWIYDFMVGSANNQFIFVPSANSPQITDGGAGGTYGAAISHQGPYVAGSYSDGWTTGPGTGHSAVTGAIALAPANLNAISETTGKYVPGSMGSFSGTLTKTMAVQLVAALATFTVAVSKQCVQSFAAVMSIFNGSIAKTPGKNIPGSLSLFNGTVTKTAAKGIPGSMAPFAGSLGSGYSRALNAVMSLFGGANSQGTGKAISGSTATFKGSQNQSTGKGVAGSTAAFGGGVTKTAAKGLSASMQGFAGTISKQIDAALAAVMALFNATIEAVKGGGHNYTVNIAANMLSFSSEVTKQVAKSVAGTMQTMGGAISKSPNKFVQASLNVFHGVVTTVSTIFVTIAASFNPFGSTVAKGTNTVAGKASMALMSAAAGKDTGKGLMASTLAFNASMAKSTGKFIQAGLNVFSGVQTRVITIFVSINASMAPFTAAVGKGYSKTLDASMGLFGGTIGAVVGKLGGWLYAILASVVPALVAGETSIVPALMCDVLSITPNLVASQVVVGNPLLRTSTFSIIPSLVGTGFVVENELTTVSSSTLLPISIPLLFTFFPGNSVPVLWGLVEGSSWPDNPVPVTDATGTLTIQDPSGTPVSGANAVSFVTTGTPGTYQANIDGTEFSPTIGSNYRTVITFTSPSAGGPAQWTINTAIRFRTTP